MKSTLLIGGLTVGLVLALLLGRSRRGGASDAALRTASGLAWEMTELHREFSDGRRARGMTPDRSRALAEATAGTLATRRDRLAALLPTLPPASPFTTAVASFVSAWPTRDTFLNDLLGDAPGEASGLAITSLAMRVTDPRRSWKTLFPLFRP